MNELRDKSLSSSSLIRKTRNHLRPRADFQDSVDEAHPVDIDYKANPWWRSRYSCWEVKGQVAEDYKEIGPSIHHELKQWCRESSWQVFVWPYMIGKSTKSAKPVIVIASEDETSREEAKAAIERSGILMHHPYFKLWPLRHLPTGPVNPVAMEDQAPPQPLPSVPSFEVYFDPTERVRPIGMPIYIRHGDTSVRRATANAVYNGIEYGYITAAHAFTKPFLDKTPSRESQDNFEFPFDSDSDNESADDAEVEVLSRYSGTSPEATESEYSTFTSSQTSGTRSQSPSRVYSTFSDTEEHPRGSIRSTRGIEVPTNPGAHPVESAPIGALQLLGRVSATFTAHDCVVIAVTNLDVISFLQATKNARENVDSTITASKARRTTVNAWTSRGPVHGDLLDLPLYMRLADSDSYQIVYKFTYDGDIKMGDCGTLVIDANTRELYGHVIADSQNRRVAFMMAAEPVMNDIKENGNWQLIAIPSASEQEHVNRIGTHAQYDLDTASVTNQQERERTLGQTSAAFPPPDRSGTPARDPPYQLRTTIATPTASNTRPRQIPSTPSSNPFPLQKFAPLFTPTPATHLYSDPLSTTNAPSLGAAYDKILSARQKASTCAVQTSGMLPPARSPGMGNPVSPFLGPSVRDNYIASTPALHRHPHILSPRHTDLSPYNTLPETPRSVAPTISYPATNITGYTAQSNQLGDTLPFSAQESSHEITCEGSTIVPKIEAKIDKGFFRSSDGAWTCYRRNYFSANVSYGLTPWIRNAPLFLHQGNRKDPEQIQSMAVFLAAAVDGIGGKNIELIQHTPKRDKGPQLSLKKELLAPTPPGNSQNSSSYGPGGFLLPLHDHPDELHQHSSPTAHNSNYQHAFERIQFKSATANNGKRRAQQQYYHLIVELWANVQNPRDNDARWVKVAARSSHPVVVRGRSPSHYQNEGPHNANTSRGTRSGGMSGLGHSSSGSNSGAAYGGSHPSGASSSGSSALGSSMGGPGLYGIGSNSGAAYGDTRRTSMFGGGSSALGGGLYRGTTYSLDPNPGGSHSVSSASTLSGGAVEGLVGDQHIAGEDDAEMIDAS